MDILQTFNTLVRKHAPSAPSSANAHGLTRAVTLLLSFLLTVSSWDPAASSAVNAV